MCKINIISTSRFRCDSQIEYICVNSYFVSINTGVGDEIGRFHRTDQSELDCDCAGRVVPREPRCSAWRPRASVCVCATSGTSSASSPFQIYHHSKYSISSFIRGIKGLFNF